MNITSKSRYALKIMIDLAQLGADVNHTQRSSLAKRQGIPPDFMDHILSRLREGKLIQSIRGRGGGFKLCRSADSISVWEIFTAVEDTFQPVQCLTHDWTCTGEDFCSSKDAWTTIMGAVQKSLGDMSLAKLVEKAPRRMQLTGTGTDSVVVPRECRAPKKPERGVVLS